MNRPAARLMGAVALALLPVAALAQGPRPLLTESDLAPVSLGRDDALARELIARHRWREAAAHISAHTPGARLVKGFLLERAGDGSGAVAALDGLAERLPVLGDFARVTLGEALLAAERMADAVKAVAAIRGESDLARLARRVRARALREAGALDLARAEYQAMIDSGHEREVPVGLLGLARLEADADQGARAIARLRRLDVEFPADWTAGQARALAAELGKADRKLVAAFGDRSPEERIARAERLLDRHRNDSVIAELEPLTKTELPVDLKCRHRYALGKALRKRRKWTTARPLLEEAVTVCTEAGSALAPWARHLAMQAAERLAFEDEAAAHCVAQMEANSDHRLADDAGYFLVRHLIDDKKDFEAARKEVEALVERFPAGDMVPDAVFFVAQQALVEHDWKTAAEVLALDDRLPPRDFDDRDAGRTIYWRARIAQETGERDAAIGGYRAAMASNRLGWYALLAYGRLRELDQRAAQRAGREALELDQPGPSLPSAETPDWRLPAPAALLSPDGQQALMLARLGLGDSAWRALQEADVEADDNALWASAFVLDRAGAWHLSHDILRRRLPWFRSFPPTGNLRKHWELAYPNPFGRLVDAAAKASGIEKYYLWAVMREESGFNPGIESFANAVGLMQLIVPTAQHMADKKDGRITAGRLTEPDLNVRLGARYVAYVRDDTGAVTPLWPAGYNAGSGALKRWLKERDRLPLDLFVEAIPFEEARGYTKRVAASWATYRYLYGGKQADPLPYVSQKTHGPPAPKKRAPKKRASKKRKPRKGRGKKTK